MIFYIIIPFLIMITFNTLLIVNLKHKLSKFPNNGQILVKRRPNLTVSLIILSFLFLVMTIPGTMLFGFFFEDILSNLNQTFIFLIDDITFLNHAMIFFISFLSNKKFRKAIIQICYGDRNNNENTNI